MPFVYLLFMGVVWGASFPLARIATGGGGHPLGLALWQEAIGGAMFLAIAAVRGRPPPVSRAHLRFYLVCGLLGAAIPGTAFFYAASRVPSGVLAIVVAIVPVATYVISVPLRLDALAPVRALGIVCGLGAVVLLVAPGTSLPDRGMVAWVLIALAGATCYAGENVFVALRWPEGGEALALIAGVMVAGTAVLAPVALAMGATVSLAPPWTEVQWAIVASGVSSALAYGVFLHVIHTSGPVFASQTAYVVTISGVLWGMAVFGERHSAWIWAAFVLMLAGLGLVRPRAPIAPPATPVPERAIAPVDRADGTPPG